MFSLQFYIWSGVWNTLAVGALFLFVLFKAPPSRTKWSLLAITASVTQWAIFYVYWAQSQTLEEASFYQKIFSVGGLLATPTTFHFVINFCEAKVSRWVLVSNYLVFAALIVINFFTDLYVSHYQPLGAIQFYPQAGPIHPFFLFMTTVNLVGVFWLLVRRLKTAQGYYAQQAKWMLLGLALAWPGGVSSYLGFYNLDIPHMLASTVSFFVGCFAYATVKHKLLDIEVVIRKTVVFAGILIGAWAAAALLLQAIPYFASVIFGITINSLLLNIFTLFMATPLLHKLRGMLVHWTDRYLFQMEVEPSVLMARILSLMNKSNSRDGLLETVLNEIVSGFRIKNGSLFIYDRRADRYQLLSWVGLNPTITILNSRSALRCLSLIQQPAGYGIRPPQKQFPDEAFQELDHLHAKIAIPIMNDRVMTAIIFLGERLSEKAYTYEDLDYLVPLSRVVSAVYHNTRLREELKVAQEKVLEAHTDSLTHVLTRAAFHERVEVEFVRARHFNRQAAVLMLDLDFFKKKNDTYGHLIGDQILAEAAQRFKSGLRTNDFIGRYGGEEFIIFLGGASKQEAIEVAERMRKKLTDSSIQTKVGLVEQTVSIGVACYPEFGHSIEDLTGAADACLYEAKKRGRNCVVEASEIKSDVKSETGNQQRAYK